MKFNFLPHTARALALVLLIAVVAALAASNAAWAGPSELGPQRQPGRSTVPRRGTDLVITEAYRRVWWGDVTFTITVTNTGPIAAEDVMVTDKIFRRLELDQATTTKGACRGDPVVRCRLGNLVVGEVVTITIRATIWMERYRGTIRNTATVDSKTHDTKTSNNSATVILNGRNGVFARFDRFQPGPDEVGSSDE
jgi:uncharacterized repeat protein (TIGR01451 family)